MILLIVLLVFWTVIVFYFSTSQTKASVVTCNSFRCGHNRRGRCTKKEIAIYDNLALGLCVHHTQSMDKRIFEPMENAIESKRKKWLVKLLNALDGIEDKALLDDPVFFAGWLNQHGIKRL
ncbi:MAG TPA: hypothetical protein DCL35_07340 [Candidatus Omnitrophica bacterium]|nr:hypothetical protein [Candidatus Omnitrophota bacterium]